MTEVILYETAGIHLALTVSVQVNKNDILDDWYVLIKSWTYIPMIVVPKYETGMVEGADCLNSTVNMEPL